MVDMGGSKKRLLDGLFRRRRNDCLMRLEDDRVHDDYVGAAAQAIVT
jgi:hypothetical protein